MDEYEQPVAHVTSPTAGGGRLPALDGLRAFAVMAVVCFHLYALPTASWTPWRPIGGYLGVDVFFVLSGFLITTLLINEFDQCGSIKLRNFYARRALRLFPALAVLIAVAGGAAAIWSSQPWSRPTLLGLPWVILYAGNWHFVMYGGLNSLGALGQTWSLAVEEQFYLLWPLILILIVRWCSNRMLIATALLAVAVAQVAYVYVVLYHAPSLIGHALEGTDGRSDGLIIGCALAFFIAAQKERPALSERVHRIVAGVTVISVIALTLLVMRETGAFGVAFGIPAAAACTAVIVFNLVTRPLPALSWVLEARPVVWIGKRSYGIYLWQGTFAGLTQTINHPGIGFSEWQAMRLVASIAIAGLSYRYVELPFLRRKRNFERTELSQAVQPAAVGASTGDGGGGRGDVPPTT